MKYLGIPQSGSVADETFARNPFGQYVRARVGRGGSGQAQMGLAVAAWQAESADVQLAWGDYARSLLQSNSLGVAVVLSGYQAYLRGWLGTYSSLGSGPVSPFSPPGVPLGWSLTAVTTAWSGGDIVWDAEIDKSVPAGRALIIERGSGPGTTGQNFGPGRGNYWLRWVRLSAEFLPTAWDASMAPGETRWWRVREFRGGDGWISHLAFALRLTRP